jgi:hypothetical protein
MPKWLKITLVSVAALAVFGTALALVARAWFRAHKDEFLAVGRRAAAAGQQFGKDADSEGCLREALRRLDADRAFVGEVEQRVFLRECLGVARRGADFCTGVPGPTEIFNLVKFAAETCKTHGHENDQRCSRVVQAIVDVCYDTAR